jgi:hypothetical protein
VEWGETGSGEGCREIARIAKIAEIETKTYGGRTRMSTDRKEREFHHGGTETRRESDDRKKIKYAFRPATSFKTMGLKRNASTP